MHILFLRPLFLASKNIGDFLKTPNTKAPDPGAEERTEIGKEIKDLPHVGPNEECPF
jgi:hypothetical protein